MAVYGVTGKLGTGKTKFAVWRAQMALREGRRVASNVDLKLDVLVPEKRVVYVRLPDKPSAFDFDAMGHGNPDSYDEERNGVLILDELGTWLNSRSFQDKSRAHILDWLIHARKHGWDVYLIVQDDGMIDKQVREALIEYSCRCMRMDKVRIPIIGRLLGSIFGGRVGYLPRFHLVTARIGYGANAVVADRWTYRGDDLHAAYDTRQIFREDYPHGAFSQFTPSTWSKPTRGIDILAARLKAQLARLVHDHSPALAPLKPKPKLHAVSLAGSLGRDEGWRWAKRYVESRA